MTPVVEVSAFHAEGGLYMTPDMVFYAIYMADDQLADSVQTIIHSKQPLTSDYAAWADYVYEHFYEWTTTAGEYFTGGEMLMAMNTYASAFHHIDRGLDILIQAALNIYFNTINLPDKGEYPRIVPHELQDMRLNRPWKINRDVFLRMLRAEPWMTWTERLRAQYNRFKTLVTNGVDLASEAKHFRERNGGNPFGVLDTAKAKAVRQKRETEARRAIKRAYKLHERIGGISDLRQFVHGNGLTLNGRLFDYTLSMDCGTLFKHTINRNTKMTPVNMVINKNGVEFARTCLYFDDTSILDHMLNVKLYVSNEETELEMLKALHITSVKAPFFGDPVLPDLKNIHDPVTAPLHTADNIITNAWDTQTFTSRRILHEMLRPAAWDAFNELMRFSPKYLRILRDAGEYNFWDYLFDAEESLPVLEQAKEIFR